MKKFLFLLIILNLYANVNTNLIPASKLFFERDAKPFYVKTLLAFNIHYFPQFALNEPLKIYSYKDNGNYGFVNYLLNNSKVNFDSALYFNKVNVLSQNIDDKILFKIEDEKNNIEQENIQKINSSKKLFFIYPKITGDAVSVSYANKRFTSTYSVSYKSPCPNASKFPTVYNRADKKCYQDLNNNHSFDVGDRIGDVKTIDNFAGWKSYDSNGRWQIRDNNTKVYQSINGRPTTFVSNFSINSNNANFLELSAKVSVGYDGDDDFIGIVWGWRDNNNFYLIDWDRSLHPSKVGWGITHSWGGFRLLKKENGIWYIFKNDTWKKVSNLWSEAGENSGGWDYNKEYTLKLYITNNEFKLYRDNIKIFDIKDINLVKNGRVGFYNYSQSSVTYWDFHIKYGINKCKDGYFINDKNYCEASSNNYTPYIFQKTINIYKPKALNIAINYNNIHYQDFYKFLFNNKVIKQLPYKYTGNVIDLNDNGKDYTLNYTLPLKDGDNKITLWYEIVGSDNESNNFDIEYLNLKNINFPMNLYTSKRDYLLYSGKTIKDLLNSYIVNNKFDAIIDTTYAKDEYLNSYLKFPFSGNIKGFAYKIENNRISNIEKFSFNFKQNQNIIPSKYSRSYVLVAQITFNNFDYTKPFNLNDAYLITLTINKPYTFIKDFDNNYINVKRINGFIYEKDNWLNDTLDTLNKLYKLNKIIEKLDEKNFLNKDDLDEVISRFNLIKRWSDLASKKGDMNALLIKNILNSNEFNNEQKALKIVENLKPIDQQTIIETLKTDDNTKIAYYKIFSKGKGFISNKYPFESVLKSAVIKKPINFVFYPKVSIVSVNNLEKNDFYLDLSQKPTDKIYTYDVYEIDGILRISISNGKSFELKRGKITSLSKADIESFLNNTDVLNNLKCSQIEVDTYLYNKTSEQAYGKINCVGANGIANNDYEVHFYNLTPQLINSPYLPVDKQVYEYKILNKKLNPLYQKCLASLSDNIESKFQAFYKYDTISNLPVLQLDKTDFDNPNISLYIERKRTLPYIIEKYKKKEIQRRYESYNENYSVLFDSKYSSDINKTIEDLYNYPFYYGINYFPFDTKWLKDDDYIPKNQITYLLKNYSTYNLYDKNNPNLVLENILYNENEDGDNNLYFHIGTISGLKNFNEGNYYINYKYNLTTKNLQLIGSKKFQISKEEENTYKFFYDLLGDRCYQTIYITINGIPLPYIDIDERTFNNLQYPSKDMKNFYDYTLIEKNASQKIYTYRVESDYFNGSHWIKFNRQSFIRVKDDYLNIDKEFSISLNLYKVSISDENNKESSNSTDNNDAITSLFGGTTNKTTKTSEQKEVLFYVPNRIEATLSNNKLFINSEEICNIDINQTDNLIFNFKKNDASYRLEVYKNGTLEYNGTINALNNNSFNNSIIIGSDIDFDTFLQCNSNPTCRVDKLNFNSLNGFINKFYYFPKTLSSDAVNTLNEVKSSSKRFYNIPSKFEVNFIKRIDFRYCNDDIVKDFYFQQPELVFSEDLKNPKLMDYTFTYNPLQINENNVSITESLDSYFKKRDEVLSYLKSSPFEINILSDDFNSTTNAEDNTSIQMVISQGKIYSKYSYRNLLGFSKLDLIDSKNKTQYSILTKNPEVNSSFVITSLSEDELKDKINEFLDNFKCSLNSQGIYTYKNLACFLGDKTNCKELCTHTYKYTDGFVVSQETNTITEPICPEGTQFINGNCVFYKISDGNNFYEIKNEGWHSYREVTQSIYLKKGFHRFLLHVWNGTGDGILTLKINGKILNDSNFIIYPSINALVNNQKGMRKYEHNYNVVDSNYYEIFTKDIYKFINQENNSYQITSSYNSHFYGNLKTFLYTGYIYIDKDGKYKIELGSDDGSDFIIDKYAFDGDEVKNSGIFNVIKSQYDILDMYSPIYLSKQTATVCQDDEIYSNNRCYLDRNKDGIADDKSVIKLDGWHVKMHYRKLNNTWNWFDDKGRTDKDITGYDWDREFHGTSPHGTLVFGKLDYKTKMYFNWGADDYHYAFLIKDNGKTVYNNRWIGDKIPFDIPSYYGDQSGFGSGSKLGDKTGDFFAMALYDGGHGVDSRNFVEVVFETNSLNPPFKYATPLNPIYGCPVGYHNDNGKCYRELACNIPNKNIYLVDENKCIHYEEIYTYGCPEVNDLGLPYQINKKTGSAPVPPINNCKSDYYEIPPQKDVYIWNKATDSLNDSDIQFDVSLNQLLRSDLYLDNEVLQDSNFLQIERINNSFVNLITKRNVKDISNKLFDFANDDKYLQIKFYPLSFAVNRTRYADNQKQKELNSKNITVNNLFIFPAYDRSVDKETDSQIEYVKDKCLDLVASNWNLLRKYEKFMEAYTHFMEYYHKNRDKILLSIRPEAFSLTTERLHVLDNNELFGFAFATSVKFYKDNLKDTSGYGGHGTWWGNKKSAVINAFKEAEETKLNVPFEEVYDYIIKHDSYDYSPLNLYKYFKVSQAQYNDIITQKLGLVKKLEVTVKKKYIFLKQTKASLTYFNNDEIEGFIKNVLNKMKGVIQVMLFLKDNKPLNKCINDLEQNGMTVLNQIDVNYQGFSDIDNLTSLIPDKFYTEIGELNNINLKTSAKVSDYSDKGIYYKNVELDTRGNTVYAPQICGNLFTQYLYYSQLDKELVELFKKLKGFNSQARVFYFNRSYPSYKYKDINEMPNILQQQACNGRINITEYQANKYKCVDENGTVFDATLIDNEYMCIKDGKEYYHQSLGDLKTNVNIFDVLFGNLGKTKEEINEYLDKMIIVKKITCDGTIDFDTNDVDRAVLDFFLIKLKPKNVDISINALYPFFSLDRMVTTKASGIDSTITNAQDALKRQSDLTFDFLDSRNDIFEACKEFKLKKEYVIINKSLYEQEGFKFESDNDGYYYYPNIDKPFVYYLKLPDGTQLKKVVKECDDIYVPEFKKTFIDGSNIITNDFISDLETVLGDRNYDLGYINEIGDNEYYIPNIDTSKLKYSLKVNDDGEVVKYFSKDMENGYSMINVEVNASTSNIEINKQKIYDEAREQVNNNEKTIQDFVDKANDAASALGHSLYTKPLQIYTDFVMPILNIVQTNDWQSNYNVPSYSVNQQSVATCVSNAKTMEEIQQCYSTQTDENIDEYRKLILEANQINSQSPSQALLNTDTNITTKGISDEDIEAIKAPNFVDNQKLQAEKEDEEIDKVQKDFDIDNELNNTNSIINSNANTVFDKTLKEDGNVTSPQENPEIKNFYQKNLELLH